MHVLVYIPWLIKEILVSGFTLCKAALSAKKPFAPVVVHYPLRVTTQWQMFWFSTSITVTPSTLSLGFREPAAEGEPHYLLVHAALGGEPEEIVAGLADMEARLNPAIADKPLGPWKVEVQ